MAIVVLVAAAVRPAAGRPRTGPTGSPPAPALPRGADALVIAVGALHVGDGRTYAPGEVLIVDGKIREVGAEVSAPAGARRWDEHDAVLTPGLVEPAAHVDLGTEEAGGGVATVTLTAADARSPWDPWLPLVREEGVVAACLSPLGSGAFDGRAVTVGTTGPGPAGAPVLQDGAALVASLSNGGRGSATRAAARDALVRALEQAEDYTAKWKEWRAKHPEPAAPAAGAAKRPRPRPLSPSERAQEPKRVPSSEILALVLDRKLPLRIEANRREEIAAALDLARTRNLTIVLTGCVECAQLADELAASQAIVLLEPLVAGTRRSDDGRPDPDTVSRLAAAGVRLAVSGGGAWPLGPAWLRTAAAELAGEGLPPDRAIAAMTGLAAEASGIGATHGLLAPGRDAELILWTQDPLSPTARVKRLVMPSDTKPDAAKPPAVAAVTSGAAS